MVYLVCESSPVGTGSSTVHSLGNMTEKDDQDDVDSSADDDSYHDTESKENGVSENKVRNDQYIEVKGRNRTKMEYENDHKNLI